MNSDEEGDNDIDDINDPEVQSQLKLDDDNVYEAD